LISQVEKCPIERKVLLSKVVSRFVDEMGNWRRQAALLIFDPFLFQGNFILMIFNTR